MILDRWPLMISAIINAEFVCIYVLSLDISYAAIPHKYDFLNLLVSFFGFQPLCVLFLGYFYIKSKPLSRLVSLTIIASTLSRADFLHHKRDLCTLVRKFDARICQITRQALYHYGVDFYIRCFLQFFTDKLLVHFYVQFKHTVYSQMQQYV